METLYLNSTDTHVKGIPFIYVSSHNKLLSTWSIFNRQNDWTASCELEEIEGNDELTWTHLQ
jgi:hypothetical protein